MKLQLHSKNKCPNAHIIFYRFDSFLPAASFLYVFWPILWMHHRHHRHDTRRPSQARLPPCDIGREDVAPWGSQWDSFRYLLSVEGRARTDSKLSGFLLHEQREQAQCSREQKHWRAFLHKLQSFIFHLVSTEILHRQPLCCEHSQSLIRYIMLIYV